MKAYLILDFIITDVSAFMEYVEKIPFGKLPSIKRLLRSVKVCCWHKAAPRKAEILETLTLYDLTAKADAWLIKSQ